MCKGCSHKLGTLGEAEADIPIEGAKAYLSQTEDHQLLFMQFDEDVELAEHTHEAQVGFVLNGRIKLIIEGVEKEYSKGDIYYIPENVKHSGKIHRGYADITFFAEPQRYSSRNSKQLKQSPS